MTAATVQGVYAEALLEVADARNTRTAVVDACRALIDALDHETIAQLDDPRIGKQRAKDVLKAALAGHLEQDVLTLLYLLVDRNRLADAPAIAREAVRLAEAAVGLERIQVATAEALSPAASTTLVDSIKRVFGPGALVAASTDASLIGGVTVRVGDLLIDGSVRRHLSEMKNRILNVPLGDRLWDL
jgi:F-type H+-transporting ATPase subunit delta